jgi:hypothetical protein
MFSQLVAEVTEVTDEMQLTAICNFYLILITLEVVREKDYTSVTSATLPGQGR